MLAIHVAIGEGDGCEVVVIGMPIPIHIEGDDVGGVHLPLATCRYRSVVVAQVVGLHIHSRMLTAGSVDAFAVDAAVSIEFNVLIEGISEMFRHLPIGVSADGLVA